MRMETPLAPFIADRVPSVLIVDGDLASLEALETCLGRWGCQTQRAREGVQAAALARESGVDLVVMEVSLPDQSGFAVCQTLAGDQATAHIPVIFITALSTIEAKITGFENGGYDYITKPFDEGELAARVGARLRQKYVLDTLREKQAGLLALVGAQRRTP